MSDHAIQIEITDAQNFLPIDPAAMVDLARRVLVDEGVVRASISIAFVDDAAIHEINLRHLAHDWPTDVITFRLSDFEDGCLEAELVVSAQMARSTADESGADPGDELTLYVVHGLLHLCGHDDITPELAARMRSREAEVLAKLGIRNTFALVGRTSAGEDSSWTV
jgi:probable rRNA maturation factor